jgi:hypothetical protein
MIRITTGVMISPGIEFGGHVDGYAGGLVILAALAGQADIYIQRHEFSFARLGGWG